MTVDDMLKAQQWERAKGELRALVALQGSYPSTEDERASRWRHLSEAVESFIASVEERALQE